MVIAMSEDTPLKEQVAILEKVVAELKDNIVDSKEGERRDFNFLSAKLMREVMKRRRCMDYKDVLSFFHFRSHTEAYRLMERTAANYPDYVKLKDVKKGKTTKKVICEG
jgi:hypothetical protein